MSFRSKTAAYFSSLMENSPRTLGDQIVLKLLHAGSILYGKGIKAKYRRYRENPQAMAHLPAIVISLGNITVGGTGKTPMSCMLARQLQTKGLRVALLNRGYRSQKEKETAIMSDGEHILLTAQEGGDEAYLMARLLPGVPVIVGRNREVAGSLAIDQFSSQVLILDDGFQHWQLARDLDIVLIDAMNPFGNERVLPRGILREPLEHLDRAGLFLITKAAGKTPEEIAVIKNKLRQYNATAPIVLATHKPKWCVPYDLWQTNRRSEFGRYGSVAEGRAVAASALGNPAGFEETISQFGYELVDALRFEDHHQYTAEDLQIMAMCAIRNDACIIITEKDAVKIPIDLIETYHVPLYVLGIEIEIIDGQATINACLDQLLGG